MAIAEPIAAIPSARRWFHPTPGKLLVVLLAVEGGLLLSERWFPKGWAVLIAVAAVGVFLLVMLLWLAVALLFHWRFQFSIRSLMVLTLAVAVPCSWLTVEMKWAREQAQAVKTVQEVRGAVKYDWCDIMFMKGGGMICPTTPDARMSDEPSPMPQEPGPVWLHNILGEDFFVDVIGVHFDDVRLTKNVFEQLAKMNELTELSFSSTQIDDATFESLERLKKLQRLEISKEQITDANLKLLKRMTNLRNLYIWGWLFTDDKVAELKKALPDCEINPPCRTIN